MISPLQKGFTLIELMIVIAIVGILSAIALPAFQDYMVRARVSEVVLAASALRSDISEFAHTNGEMPSTGAITPPPGGSKWVASIAYQGETASTGVVTAMATGDPKIASATITMRGELRDNGQVDWTCSGTITARYRPASCR